MTIADTYDTGTVSVDSSGNVTGSGVIWSLVKKFDLISIDGGDLRIITEVTDTTHLKIQPWSGTASAKPYVIYYNALLRLTNGELALRTQELVKTITGDGYFVYVASADSAPDPAKGKDGQYALKPSTGATWLKSSGVWNATGTLGALYPASNLSDVANVATARSNLGILSVPREVLTANRTYYVRTDGNNSNNGLANTSGGAFLTIQKAVDVVMALDLNGYTVTISVSDGTYTSGVFLGALTGRGNGSVDIVGNTTTPANCIVSVSGAHGFRVTGSGWTARGFKTITTTAGTHILVQANSIFNVYEWNFGAAAAYYDHMAADTGGILYFNSNYTISGGANTHWQADLGGSIIRGGATTVTLSGTPAFAGAFAFAWRGGKVYCPNQTFSGSATGLRYTVGSLGQILTFGGGASYLPGNSAGYVDTATYGVYS